MSKIFLGLFFFYLTSGSTQYLSSNGLSSRECYVCDTHAFCGYNISNLPTCLNGSSCTEDQLQACEDIFLGNFVKICDRPGIFPDQESPENYYRCWITSATPKIIRQKIKCPEYTVFHPQAMLCLNEAERKILKQIEGYLPPESNEHSAILCKKSGFYAYPQDCKRYYYCEEDKLSQVFECPFGTYYSYKKKNCTTKLAPYCKSQLNKRAKVQRLHAVRLLAKIKSMSKQQIPHGMCMRFCENNWQIIAENKPEVDFVTEHASPQFTYKVNIHLLNKYEHSALQLDNMLDRIIKAENEDEEEKEDESELHSNNIANSKRMKNIWTRLIIKALLRIIESVKSFLRQYIKERICPHPHDSSEGEKSNTTQKPDYSEPEYSDVTLKPSTSYTVPNNSTTAATTYVTTAFDSSTSNPSASTTEAGEFDSSTSTFTEKSASTTASANSDSYTASENYDSKDDTNEPDSSPSSHPSAFTSEAGEFGSSTSIFTEKSASTTAPANSDSYTASENYDSKDDTNEPDSSPSSHPSAFTSEAGEFGSSTSTFTEKSASTTASENSDSYTASENYDSKDDTNEPDSSPSSHPSAFTSEAGEFGSSTSIFTEKSASTTAPANSDSYTASENYDSKDDTNEPDSSPSSHPSAFTSEAGEFGSSTSTFTEKSASTTASENSDSYTASENYDSGDDTNEPDSSPSSHPSASTTDAGDFGSSKASEHSDFTTSSTDISTESEPHKGNSSLSPFCALTETE